MIFVSSVVPAKVGTHAFSLNESGLQKGPVLPLNFIYNKKPHLRIIEAVVRQIS